MHHQPIEREIIKSIAIRAVKAAVGIAISLGVVDGLQKCLATNLI
ncbi:hypothetical protein [Avibacterium paragallinarum]